MLLKPTLAVYCREPVLGKGKTRLAAEIGKDGALQFYQGCIRLLRAELLTLADRFRIVICPSAEHGRKWAGDEFPFAELVLTQRDDPNLGVRLAESFRDLQENGAERILVIGSDSPSLPLSLIDDLEHLLGEFDTALGPSLDGGVWGIATKQTLPDISKIAWSTATVCNGLTGAFQRADLTVGFAADWYDVDTGLGLRLASDDLIRSESRQRQEFGTWIESLYFREMPRGGV